MLLGKKDCCVHITSDYISASEVPLKKSFLSEKCQNILLAWRTEGLLTVYKTSDHIPDEF